MYGGWKKWFTWLVYTAHCRLKMLRRQRVSCSHGQPTHTHTRFSIFFLPVIVVVHACSQANFSESSRAFTVETYGWTVYSVETPVSAGWGLWQFMCCWLVVKISRFGTLNYWRIVFLPLYTGNDPPWQPRRVVTNSIPRRCTKLEDFYTRDCR